MKKLTFILIIQFIIGSDIKFDGNNAFVFLKEQCAFGPRFPGSSGHNKLIQYLNNHFQIYADSVEIFRDSIIHPFTNEKLEINNLLIRHNVDAEERYLFMAHFDTRDRADKDLDETKIMLPILGANDGASGVALLMELSRILNNNPLSNIGVDILLVDAEDMGKSGHVDQWGLVTQSFVNQYKG